MSLQTISDVLERAKEWSAEDQESLTAFAREIESQRTGVYTLDEQERKTIENALAEANKGELVSEEILSQLKARFSVV